MLRWGKMEEGNFLCHLQLPMTPQIHQNTYMRAIPVHTSRNSSLKLAAPCLPLEPRTSPWVPGPDLWVPSNTEEAGEVWSGLMA